MRNILMSGATIIFAGAMLVSATGAFFSDTETSTGNTFAAGAIDLQVDSTAHYAGLVCVNGEWADDPNPAFGPLTRPELIGQSCGGSWEQTDLGPANKFFNYADVKPGDPGEDTISLHVPNDAWMCANMHVTSSVDGGGGSFVAANTFASDFENPPYTLGNINGQNGWSKTGAYDSAVSASGGATGFGAQSLRVSNGFADGAFGGQTFAPQLSSGAGETSVAPNKHFEAQFDIASVLPTLQTGLAVSVSPDDGNGSRMSYLRFEDQSDGIHVFFDDVTDAGPVGTTATFNETDIATITRTPHTIKFVIDFVDGPGNDIVKIYIDGVLKITGTTWEDYYRFDPEQNGNGHVISPVDTLIFAARGSSVPANNGNGYLFDNLTITDGNVSGAGSLADGIEFYAWRDDGDNLHQLGETGLFGPAALGSGAGTTTLPLADASHLPAFTANSTHYVGLAWCAGDLTIDGATGALLCNGNTLGNEAQNDSMSADITLTAVQSRNNPSFLCNPPAIDQVI